jgi:hypothetical protein
MLRNSSAPSTGIHCKQSNGASFASIHGFFLFFVRSTREKKQQQNERNRWKKVELVQLQRRKTLVAKTQAVAEDVAAAEGEVVDGVVDVAGAEVIVEKCKIWSSNSMPTIAKTF